jgi:hypothetical protein
MAIQRQTPQFDPTRIVQPTATPIDTYFRPMLRQPEPSSLMQVAQALGGISPQLGRLASDAMAANIAAQREYGQYEASTEKDPEVLRRKATEAIENSGGIAPWRYQAFLEAYGQRMVRDKYRNALWNNLDDLSNPYNSDGTVRAPTYIAEQMSKMYQDAGIPENSYFINKGAATARAEADNSFYDRLMAARRQKVLEKSEEVLRDGLQFSIETAHDISSVFGPKGAIKALTDEYYRQGGQDGDKIMVDTVIATARGAAAEGNYDRALRLLRYPLDEKVGERTLGNRYRPELQQVYDQLYERSREAELNEARDTEALKQTTTLELKDKILAVLQEERKKGPNINLDETQIGALVDRELSGINVPDNIKAAVKARGVDWTRNQIDQMSNKTKREERVDESTAVRLMKIARTAPRAEFQAQAESLQGLGIIDYPTYMRLIEVNRSMNGLQEVDRQRMMAALNSISGIGWAGMTEQQVSLDGRAELSAIGDRAATDVMDAFFAEINSGAFKQKYPDEIERSMAQPQILDRLVREKQSQLRATYQSRLEQFDLTRSFDAAIKPGVDAEISGFTETVLGELGIPDGYEKTSLSRRIGAAMLTRLRDDWASIHSNPGEIPMTLEQRKMEFYRRLPDVADTLNLDIRNNPESLGLPANAVNLLRGAAAAKAQETIDMSAAGVPGVMQATVNPQVSQFRAPGTSYFGTAANAAFTAEGDISWPSEAGLISEAGKVDSMLEAARSDPAARIKHNEAKANLNKNAEALINEMTSTTAKTFVDRGGWRMLPGNLRPARQVPDVPLYEIRPDGLYVLTELNGTRVKSPLMTDRYWAAKSFIGYSPDEIKNGKTSEGIDIPPTRLNPAEYLYFKSVEEFNKAVVEYTGSSGKSGIIATEYLPISNADFESFRIQQLNLLRNRKPFR